MDQQNPILILFILSITHTLSLQDALSIKQALQYNWEV